EKIGPAFSSHLDNFAECPVRRKFEAHRINQLCKIDTLGENDTATICTTVIALDSGRYANNSRPIAFCCRRVGHTCIGDRILRLQERKRSTRRKQKKDKTNLPNLQTTRMQYVSGGG